MTDTFQLAFNRRPMPVLVEHRPLYKVAEVVLTLYLACNRTRSSLLRLHLFNWGLKTPARVEALSQAARRKKLTMVVWGFDPALAVALRYLEGEKLISEAAGGKFVLEPAGQRLARVLMADDSVMRAVKRDLVAIGKGISEDMVSAVAKEWKAQ
jgi:hypothetical protein